VSILLSLFVEFVLIIQGHGHLYAGHKLLQVSATLFSALVVACDVCFAKRSADLAEDCNREERQGSRNIAYWFSMVENHQEEFRELPFLELSI
jgi:hypothetical protein